MILTSAKDVVVEYDGRRVLDGLQLQVPETDRVAVTGRSGSGKTTLLLVMAGLLAPTRGTVTLGIPSRDIVYVPQAPSLIPELSAVDNASLGLRLRGTAPPLARERAIAALALLGLGEALSALPAELSGGMQQRVALARALTTAPRLILADEPTGALDRAAGRQVLLALKQHAAREGTALLVATHDPEVARQFSRQIALTDGQVAA